MMRDMNRRFLFLVIGLSFLFLSNRGEGQQISLSTNILDYAAFGTINLSGSYSLNRHYSIFLEGLYNPFEFGGAENRKQFKQIALVTGVRYWPWFVNSSWFFSGGVRVTKFSYGGIFTKKSYEGRAFGADFRGGYAWMLGEKVNLEIGLGAFVGGAKYKRYSCVVCGIEEMEKSKIVASPSDVLMAITIVF